MIDQLSSVSGQQLVETAQRNEDLYGQQIKENKIRSQKPGGDIDGRKEEFKKVAKEMESLFAFQLLKVMRETNDNMSEDSEGIGQDTYMSLFDMEVSKMFADRGLGLQPNIVSWLERSAGINKNEK